MKKYTLKITREFQADRPSDEFLALDNIVNGIPQWLTQDPTKDSYITIEDENNDINRRINEIEAIEARSPLARKIKDGIDIYEHPHSGIVTYETSLREGAVASIQVLDIDTTQDFDTYEEAQAFISDLDHKTGWVFIDKLEEEPSKVINSRPSINPEYYEQAEYLGKIVRSVDNAWGR